MLDMIILAVCQYLYSIEFSEILTAVLGSAVLGISCCAPRYMVFARHPKLGSTYAIPVIRAIPLSPAALSPGYLSWMPIFPAHIGIRPLHLSWRRPQPTGFIIRRAAYD